MTRALLMAMSLAACGYPKDTYVADRNEVLCTILVSCFDRYEDTAACQSAQRRDPERPCGAYDPTKARACVRRLRDEAKDCPTTDIRTWQIPVECGDVCIYPQWDTGT